MNNQELKEMILNTIDFHIEAIGATYGKDSLQPIKETIANQILVLIQPQYLSESEIKDELNLLISDYALNGQLGRNLVNDIASTLANKIPKPPQYCECKEPKEDLSNGVHPGYCKHCHNLLPLDKHTLEQIRHTLNVIYNENPINFPQDNKEPMPIGGICLNCGREVCICKCPKDNKEPIEELSLMKYFHYPSTSNKDTSEILMIENKLNEIIQEVNALSELVRSK